MRDMQMKSVLFYVFTEENITEESSNWGHKFWKYGRYGSVEPNLALFAQLCNLLSATLQIDSLIFFEEIAAVLAWQLHELLWKKKSKPNLKRIELRT